MRILGILLRWDLPRVDSQFVIIVLLVSFGSYSTLFPHYKALLFYLVISPVPTCLVHNCETSRRFAIPICCYPCLKIKFPLTPITVTKAPLENTVSWSLMDPPYSVVPLFAPPILNLMDVMQSKYIPSQAFLACCPLQSLPKLHLHLLPRSSFGYILCSAQDIPLVPVFLLSIDLHLQFQRQCRWG